MRHEFGPKKKELHSDKQLNVVDCVRKQSNTSSEHQMMNPRPSSTSESLTLLRAMPIAHSSLNGSPASESRREEERRRGGEEWRRGEETRGEERRGEEER